MPTDPQSQPTQPAPQSSPSQTDIAGLKNRADHDAIVSETDGRGLITYVNDNFCRISGYTREELIGKSHKLVNSGVHPKSFWKDMFATIVHEGVWRGDICNRSKDKTLYWIRTTIGVFRDAQGKVTSYTSIGSDITAVKESESAHVANRLRAKSTNIINKELADSLEAELELTEAKAEAKAPIPLVLSEFSERCLGNAAIAALLLEKFEEELSVDFPDGWQAEETEGAALIRTARALKDAAGVVKKSVLRSLEGDLPPDADANAVAAPVLDRQAHYEYLTTTIQSLRAEVERCLGFVPNTRMRLADAEASQQTQRSVG